MIGQRLSGSGVEILAHSVLLRLRRAKDQEAYDQQQLTLIED